MLCDVDDIFVMTGNDVNILLRRAALVPRNPDFMVIKSTKTILLFNLLKVSCYPVSQLNVRGTAKRVTPASPLPLGMEGANFQPQARC